jgi:DNA polymerase-3 subunit epsilon
MAGNAVREIILDTETTGLDPEAGHRILEVACVELVNCIPTGRVFQKYINPERDIALEAYQIHGLTREFLLQHPRFADIVDELLGFIGASSLVMHNAEFDLAFLNAEFLRCGRPRFDLCTIIDTVALAKQKYPGAQVNLNALCRRFGVDCSARQYHGALLDCQLLAEVYIELCGGRQRALDLAVAGGGLIRPDLPPRERRAIRRYEPSQDELDAHQMAIRKIPEAIWNT